MRPNKVKHALNRGEVQIGTWINTLPNPRVVQMMSAAGFEFIYIDMEHSSFSIETVGDLCFTALSVGLVPIVRPPAKEPQLLSRPLDSGAMGLLIPHVDTEVEAGDVVRAIKYPPLGERGLSLRGVHTGFSKCDGQEYVKATNEETLLIVQIESDKGIRTLKKSSRWKGLMGRLSDEGIFQVIWGCPARPTILK